MKPQILIDDPRGWHNKNPASHDRMMRSNTLKDLSTIMLVVTRGTIPARVVQSWLNLAPPINQKFFRMFLENYEVGEGYNTAIECILGHPELSKFVYVLCVEEDTAPPPDGLLTLYQDIGKYDVCGGLYWTKGNGASAPGAAGGGVPQAWGSPTSIPKNFAPFLPPPNSVTEVNGTGMGFTLFKMSLFKKLTKPYFKTVQERVPGGGMSASTQDLGFAAKASQEAGARFAISTNCLVGHWSQAEQIMW